ncbi:RHS repeat domain-containing protein [Streptomyces massasporeus]
METREYTNAERTAYESTHYGYDRLGRLAKVTDAAGLEHDAKQADVDARAVTLARILTWSAGPFQPFEPGPTPRAVVRSAEENQQERLAELDGLRAELVSTGLRLAAALDGEEPLFASANAAPIALLHVRIETKWTDDARSLKVRVYPDDIHIDAFEPALTPAELEAARVYWADPGEAAWQVLLGMERRGLAVVPGVVVFIAVI